MGRFFSLLSLVGIMLIGTSASAIDPTTAFEGQRLYVSHCQLCHGPDGKGGGPLAQNLDLDMIDLTLSMRARSETMLRTIITGEGGPIVTGRDRHNILTDAMPDWGEVFDEAQVEALIAYMRFLATAKHELLGDPERGAVLYEKYCAVCHGEEGYGDGPMTKLIDLEPADHTNALTMDRLSNEDLINFILEGNGEYMPGWQGILDKQEIEALVSYIRLLAQ
jgi:mono/diheme cytochrome c family protein